MATGVKAAILREINQPLSIETITLDKPAAGEVLVRTAVAGVCHSDFHFMNGSYKTPLPSVMGHESAGVVEQVGPGVTYVRPGDHVISCMSMFCGSCRYCLSGESYSCERTDTLLRTSDQTPRASQQGSLMHLGYELGSFAEMMLLPERAIVKIRDDMPMDRAALIGCAVTTGVGAVFKTAKVQAGSVVAVIGCGGIGLSTINGAAIAGARQIIAIDIKPEKLDMALAFGATDTISAADGDVVAAVLDMTDGGVDYSFEALGKKLTAEQAFNMLRSSGTACVIGMVPEHEKIEISGPSLINDRKLIGCNMGSNAFRIDMPVLVDLYLQGRLHLDELISKRIQLQDVNQAFDEMLNGSVARSVIVFDSDS